MKIRHFVAAAAIALCALTSAAPPASAQTCMPSMRVWRFSTGWGMYTCLTITQIDCSMSTSCG